MKRSYDVVIVGSGMAGLAAAHTLSQYRLRVLILDENIHTGGQLLRKIQKSQGTKKIWRPNGLKQIGYHLIDHTRHQNIDILSGTQVFGIYPENQIYFEDSEGRIGELKADFIVCATGAREKYLPFKGWTLPGVISTGAAQIMIKDSGILPARKALIGGCGPLQLVFAGEMLTHNGRVIALLDQTSPVSKLSILKLWRHHLPKFLEGARYLFKLLASGVPLRQRTRLIEAEGRRQLEKVITTKINRKGHPIPGSESSYPTNSLAIGYGFTPNIELPLQAGCRVEYDHEKGGWIVAVDDTMETSLQNFYAVGEITGIAGGKKSYIEGQIAAWSILRKIGVIEENQAHGQLVSLSRQRQHEESYGKYLNNLSCFPTAIYDTIPDETIICRCEDITMGVIRKQLNNGFKTAGALKKATRCGMGNCQGRICGPILYDIIRADTRQSPDQIGPLSIRSPVKSVRLEALAAMNAD